MHWLVPARIWIHFHRYLRAGVASPKRTAQDRGDHGGQGGRGIRTLGVRCLWLPRLWQNAASSTPTGGSAPPPNEPSTPAGRQRVSPHALDTLADQSAESPGTGISRNPQKRLGRRAQTRRSQARVPASARFVEFRGTLARRLARCPTKPQVRGTKNRHPSLTPARHLGHRNGPRAGYG